jgi:crotonobetainyl-CoA:carnitine CoA-transferase CaiB-like acyl-CoA transferase
VNAPREAERDPHIVARGLVVGEGGATRVRSSLGAAGEADGSPPPGLGEHTLDVLAAAGFAPDEVAALQRDGVVAGPATPESTARAERLASVLARLAERGRT